MSIENEFNLARINTINIACGILLFFSIERLSSKHLCRRGNMFAIIAILIAITCTIVLNDFKIIYIFFLIALVSGGVVGIISSIIINLTRIPEYITIMNSLVGLSAVSRAFNTFLNYDSLNLSPFHNIILILLQVVFGSITFSGSFIAFLKFLHILDKPLVCMGCRRHLLNFMLLAGTIYFLIMFISTQSILYLIYVSGSSAILAANLILAISASDISIIAMMMNFYSGLSIVSEGFIAKNNLIIMAGALVTSSGAVLSYIISRKVGKSLFIIIMGLDVYSQKIFNKSESFIENRVNSTSTIKDLAISLNKARDIIIVPGYGLTKSKSNFDLASLIKFLESENTKKIRICLHPAAGRLPGLLNLLLNEANLNHKIFFDLNEMNDSFKTCDLALVLGANDIVNSSAEEDPTSPIYRIPICKVWEAKKCILIKRSLSSGYNNIDNSLFYKENTSIILGDVSEVLTKTLSLMQSSRELFVLKSINDSGASVKIDKSILQKLKTKNLEETLDPNTIKYLSIGVPKEIINNEKRVSIIPNSATKLLNLGFNLFVESGAGDLSGYSDDDYISSGATIVSKQELYIKTDLLIKIHPPLFDLKNNFDELKLYCNLKFLISNIYPRTNIELIKKLALNKNLTVIACDCVPKYIPILNRNLKAQNFDSASSTSNVLGYRAVLEAFYNFNGNPNSVKSSDGKTAIAMGSKVKAFDYRTQMKDKVEMLGAKFIDIKLHLDLLCLNEYAREMSDNYLKEVKRLLESYVTKTDIIICSITDSGKSSPKIITKTMVKSMRKGSVIIDLYSDHGGNCELTIPDEEYIEKISRVFISGKLDLLSKSSRASSELYSNKMYCLLKEILKIKQNNNNNAKNFEINLNDEIMREMVIMYYGKYIWKMPENTMKEEINTINRVTISSKNNYYSMNSDENLFSNRVSYVDNNYLPLSGKKINKQPSHLLKTIMDILFVLFGTLFTHFIFLGIFYNLSLDFMGYWFIFVLSLYIGYTLIWKVDPCLYTVLISLTNSISGIIILDELIQLNDQGSFINSCISFLTLFLTSGIISGGLYINQKMLNLIAIH